MSVATTIFPEANAASEDDGAGRYVTATAMHGRLQVSDLSSGERTTAVWLHLTPLLGVIVFWPLGIIVPLVLWAMRRDDSPFIDDHGREVLNFIISFVLLHLILFVTIIGIPFVLVLWVVGIVNVIRGALAAGRDEFFRYPMTIRIIS